jgi:ankyrin repeat protein/predicted DNA-binding WGR domain protein
MNFYVSKSSFTNELIDLGASLDVQNHLGETLMQKVVEAQDLSTAEKILKLGVDLKLKVSLKKTILNLAVEKKNLKLVRMLLDHGADPNLPDGKGLTALHMAFNLAESTADASFDMESLLLLFKADINLQDEKGRTPLHYSFIKLGRISEISHIDPIEAVSSACSSKKINVNIQDRFKRTPLHYAAQRGAITSTMFMLSKGADLEIADSQGNTPLAISIKSGHANYAVMLVQQSADVNKDVFVLRDPEYDLEAAEYSGYPASYSNSNSCFGNYYYSGYQQATSLQIGTYSMFKAAIIQGWQGLAYLLIFNGYPYMLAMQDAMTQGKFMLVKTLLAKVSENADLQKANEKGQNLFHTLAQYGRHADYEVTNLICEQLIDRGVDLHLKDSQGKSPLHYAVMSDYMVFASILANNNVSVNDLDSSNLSPVAYAVQGARISSSLPYLQLFASFGADFRFRFQERQVSLTPILHAIKSIAPREVIKFLLEHGSSLQETDSLGQNAFIYAVLNKDLPLVKALIYEGTLDLAQADLTGKTALIYAVMNNDLPIVSEIVRSSNRGIDQVDCEGKHVLHYVVQPFDYGSYENSEMLELLLPLHPQPFSNDKEGNSIWTFAQKQRSGVMIKVIRDFINKSNIDPGQFMDVERKLSVYEENDFPFDYLHDAEDYVKLQSEIIDTTQVERSPDSNGEFPNYYKVLDDFDLLMTKVDLGFGPYSNYVFYRMQLLHDTNRDVFVLYTRWGRIGEVGASQRTPFSERDEAVKEFCKIFKAKTFNEWGQPFEKKRGKYLPMKSTKTRPKYKEYINEFKPELHPKTDLQEAILTAVKDFTSQNMFKSFFHTNSLDINVLNFSNISRDILYSAEKVLYDLLNYVKLFESETETDKKLDLISQMQELSSRYYELIPLIHHQDSAIPPIMTQSEIQTHLERLLTLKDLEVASKVILAALHREREVNPYEYILKSLRINLKVVPFDSSEFKLIQLYMKTGQTRILSVFKVNRKGEDERIEKFKDVKNRKLLWHGTRSMNLISILQQGLKIAPPEAPSTGYMFGKGVYFADTFVKSLGYCNANYSSTCFMLLCEVVLGNMLEVSHAQYIEKLPEEYLSTKGVGYQQPDPKQSIFTPEGIEVPIGDIISNSNYYSGGLSQNEYIVYNTSQIKLRYLLHLKR